MTIDLVDVCVCGIAAHLSHVSDSFLVAVTDAHGLFDETTQTSMLVSSLLPLCCSCCCCFSLFLLLLLVDFSSRPFFLLSLLSSRRSPSEQSFAISLTCSGLVKICWMSMFCIAFDDGWRYWSIVDVVTGWWWCWLGWGEISAER